MVTPSDAVLRIIIVMAIAGIILRFKAGNIISHRELKSDIDHSKLGVLP